MDYTQILKGIALGAFYGLEAGIVNYMSGEDLPVSWSSLFTAKFWRDLSLTKLAKTVLLGAVIGAITQGYQFVTPDQWAQFTATTGFPAIPLAVITNVATTAVYMGIDRLTKFVIRRTPLVKGWDRLKTEILKLLSDLDKAKQFIQASQPAPAPAPTAPTPAPSS